MSACALRSVSALVRASSSVAAFLVALPLSWVALVAASSDFFCASFAAANEWMVTICASVTLCS